MGNTTCSVLNKISLESLKSTQGATTTCKVHQYLQRLEPCEALWNDTDLTLEQLIDVLAYGVEVMEARMNIPGTTMTCLMKSHVLADMSRHCKMELELCQEWVAAKHRISFQNAYDCWEDVQQGMCRSLAGGWRKTLRDLLLDNGLDQQEDFAVWSKPGVGIRSTCSRGQTLLHRICARQFWALAQPLVDYGCPINTQDRDGCTALLLATEHGAWPVCKLLVQAKANVQIADLKGETPLLVACRQQHVGIALLLIKAGAKVQSKTTKGATALALSVQGPEQLVRCLLDADANPGAVYKGRTALLLALQHLPSSHVVCMLILQHMGPPALDRPDPLGMNPLHHAIQGGDQVLLAALLAQGADPHYVCDGCPPLASAAGIGLLDACRSLLQYQADPDVGDALRHAPLVYAARGGHMAVCQLLLEHGANPNITGMDGAAPLLMALGQRDWPLCLALVQAGCNLDLKDPSANSQRALELAMQYGQLDLSTEMVARGADLNWHRAGEDGVPPLLLALSARWTGLALAMIAKGVNPNARRADGTGALQLSAFQGWDVMSEALLDAGADVSPQAGGTSVCIHLLEKGCLRLCLRLLEQACFDAQAQDEHGNTLLMLVISRATGSCFSSAEANSLDRADGAVNGKIHGHAVLEAPEDHFKLLQLLIARKANLDHVVGGQSALTMALRNQNETVANLLLDEGAELLHVPPEVIEAAAIAGMQTVCERMKQTSEAQLEGK